jgi:hypothetical protein
MNPQDTIVTIQVPQSVAKRLEIERLFGMLSNRDQTELVKSLASKVNLHTKTNYSPPIPLPKAPKNRQPQRTSMKSKEEKDLSIKVKDLNRKIKEASASSGHDLEPDHALILERKRVLCSLKNFKADTGSKSSSAMPST